MKRIARSALVECSAEAFYALVADVEAYPRFLPWCSAARVLERGPDGGTVVALTLAAKGLRYSFTTENAYRPGLAIDMKLREGPFRHFEAHWRFTPLQAQAAKIEYSMEYELAGGPLAQLLAPIFSRLADRTVDAFVRRSKEPARA